jgi:flagellar basal-body rod protein FlgC
MQFTQTANRRPEKGKDQLVNLFGLMETSGSAMQAERMRAEVVASNMANAETTRTESGDVYRRHIVVFSSDTRGTGAGIDRTDVPQFPGINNVGNLFSGFPENSVLPGVRVSQVVEDTASPLKRYDPGHPDAGPDGYVTYPNIDPLTEMVDLMGATRAYALNGSAVQAEKNMITSALEIAKG